ncbi:MAG: PHB depolymerase family esterase, partial [Clostridia bacterium]|nr:PHB depolymerase family esterase [Clostridia bacterium]
MEKPFIRLGFKKALSMFLSIILALSVFVPLSSVITASAGTSVTGSTVSGISSSIYIPSSYKEGTKVPLYVSMHGCTQTYSQFATASDINNLAEQKGFIVLHLQQSSSNNMRTCFKWYSDQSRTSTEPKAIISIIDDVKSKYTIDNDKVFCFGFSAGAAMTHLLCACYPDVFAGGAVASGLPFKSATLLNYSTAMSSGTSVANDTLAGYIVSAMGSYSRVIPMIVFHGTSDSTVNYKNGAACTMSWVLAMNQIGADISTTPTKTSGSNYTVETYVDANTGKNVVQYYLVSNMDHAWSGGKGSSYAYANGPDATKIMYEFFENYWEGTPSEPADTTAPITTVNPSAGSYTSEITVSFSVNEDAITYYTTNGSTPTTSSAVYKSPFKVSTDTTVKYFSVDAAGNKENVKTAVYDINIPVLDTTPPVTTASPAAGVYYEPVTVTLSVNENAITYYTTDGSNPTKSSSVYTGSFVVSEDTTVKFFSVDEAGNSESIKSVSYIVVAEDVDGESIELTIAGRPAKLYISGKYREGIDMPLVVMLHGDGQTAEQFELLTNMNDVADEKGFIVLYLSADSSSPLTSWKWYSSSVQAGAGDAAYIVNAINTIASTYSIDNNKIYAAGFGAGAAMANVASVTSPELIKAVAVVSGAPYASASDLDSSFRAKEGYNSSSSSSVISAMGANSSVTPVIVIHGANDNVFDPANAEFVISQWADANDIFDNETDDDSVVSTPSRTQNGNSYTKYTYNNSNGVLIMEKYVVNGMGYAWSGGNEAGDYAYVSGPDASALIWDFFANTADNSYYVEPPVIDDVAPVTSALPEGGTYETSVTVSLSANESATIYYTTDGSVPTKSSAIYTSPLTLTKTTTLKFFSIDEAGNAENVKTETYTIVEKQITVTEISYDKSNSGYAGSITYFGYGTDVIKAGLAGLYNGESYKGIISFDTSGINVSNISNAVLRLQVSEWGSAVNTISLDIVNGYFGSAGVQVSDFSASASATGIATSAPVSSGYIELTIPATSYQHLNSHVEFRICSTVTNGFSESVVKFSDATLIITSGSAKSATYSLKSSEEDVVSFDDEALKNALISAGYDKNADSELSTEEMAVIYGINLSGLGLTSISGLEYAINLKLVDISNNTLTSIDALSSCDALQYVDISNNSIESIEPLANADEMLILIADNNKITSISALENNRSLITVSFNGNRISDISALGGITSLRSVSLDNNEIENISAISALNYVNYLFVADNDVISLADIAGLNYLFEADFSRNRLDLTGGTDDADVIGALINNGVDVAFGDQKSRIKTDIYDVTYVIEGEQVVFTIKSSPDFNRIKVTTPDNLKGYLKYTSSFTVDEEGYYISTITVIAVVGTTRYAFDGRVADTGIYASDYYYIDVTIEPEEDPIKSITYEVINNKLVFTVVTSAGEFNRIKVTLADSVSKSLAVSDSYTVDANGNYIWTIKTAAPVESTSYAFDLRSSSTGKYVNKYGYAEFIYVEVFKSVSYSVVGDKIVFTVVTAAGDYNRIKVADAVSVGTSLGVGNYTVDANGNCVWTVKANAPKETTTYAFDLRTSEMKYLKDYYE